MDETYVLDISYVCCETCLLKYIYIYIYHIFAVKCLDIRKNRIKRGNAGSLPSANLCNLGALGADPFGHFAVCGRRQRIVWSAVCGGRQRVAAADGKERGG